MDELFEREFNAAALSNHPALLLDHDALVWGDTDRALRSVPPASHGKPTLIYRGWMIPVDLYQRLHAALEARGYSPLTSASSYKLCHHLPEWYSLLAGQTPESVWLHGLPPFTAQAIEQLLERLGSGAAIVKDFVKSEKHAWKEACFIPDVRDFAPATAIIHEFINRRGTDFEGGLVLRRFVPLACVSAVAPRLHDLPSSEEWRIFWLRGKPVFLIPGFESGQTGTPPKLELFQSLAAKIQSPFFTMDIARAADGSWVIIELGDAQVAGLPDSADPAVMFRALAS